MSKGNTTEVDILAKVFKATALSWDAVTDLDLHLHTADPGEGTWHYRFAGTGAVKAAGESAFVVRQSRFANP